MRSLEMLNFCESGEFSTTLSSFQESPDKMILDFYSFPNLPGFAWATLISFVLTLPVSPLSDFIVGTVGKFNFSLVGLPLLAFAGISVGEQLGVLKKLSWKIVLISFLVMASTYWGSALI